MEKIRFNVLLRPEIEQRVRRATKILGVTRNAVMSQAVVEYLARFERRYGAGR